MELPSASATIVCRAIGTEPETRYGPFSVTLICIVSSGSMGASRERAASALSWDTGVPPFLSPSSAVANVPLAEWAGGRQVRDLAVDLSRPIAALRRYPVAFGSESPPRGAPLECARNRCPDAGALRDLFGSPAVPRHAARGTSSFRAQ